jgi:hypothetical protein
MRCFFVICFVICQVRLGIRSFAVGRTPPLNLDLVYFGVSFRNFTCHIGSVYITYQ